MSIQRVRDAESRQSLLAIRVQDCPQKSIRQFSSYRIHTNSDSLKWERKAYSSFSTV